MKIKKFFSETLIELKKSSWPTGKSLQKSTAIVVVAMLLLGSYVSVVDFSLFHSIKFINLFVR